MRQLRPAVGIPARCHVPHPLPAQRPESVVIELSSDEKQHPQEHPHVDIVDLDESFDELPDLAPVAVPVVVVVPAFRLPRAVVLLEHLPEQHPEPMVEEQDEVEVPEIDWAALEGHLGVLADQPQPDNLQVDWCMIARCCAASSSSVDSRNRPLNQPCIIK